MYAWLFSNLSICQTCSLCSLVGLGFGLFGVSLVANIAEEDGDAEEEGGRKGDCF